jgi:hypothetical protein
MVELMEKRKETGATITPRSTQYELFTHSGLVETDDRLYEEILRLVKLQTTELLRAITRANINKAIETLEAEKNLSHLNIVMLNKKNIALKLFINNINIEQGEAKAEIVLSLPWAGIVEGHTLILKKILKLIPEEQQRKFGIEYGDIYLTVNFSGKIFPKEIGENGNHQRKFVAIEKSHSLEQKAEPVTEEIGI